MDTATTIDRPAPGYLPESSPRPCSAVTLVLADEREPLSAIDALLRRPTEVFAKLEAGEGSRHLGRALTLTVVGGSACFGAALGLFRGGEQVLYAALKLPLVFVFTAALCSPVLSALRVVIEGRTDRRRDLLVVLAGFARTGLGLGALAPVVLFARAMEASYHATIVLVVVLAGCAGGMGFLAMLRCVRAVLPSMKAAAMFVMLAVYALVGTQLTWTLRPWLVRPRTPDVPFVRSLEGSFLEATLTSVSSARGVYRRDAAPLPGESPFPQPRDASRPGATQPGAFQPGASQSGAPASSGRPEGITRGGGEASGPAAAVGQCGGKP